MRAFLLAALLAGLSGCATQPRTPLPPLRASSTEGTDDATRATRNLRVFDAVWNHINRHYYDPRFNGADWAAAAAEFAPQAAKAADEPALYAVLNTMLARLHDGHTNVLPPSKARDMRKQQLTGIGVRFMRFNDQYVVLDVLGGGTAKKAGIMPGWVLLSRDGVSLDEAKPLKAGQVALYAFLDLTGARVELTLAAQEISLVHREARTLRDGVGYIRFDEFDFDSVGWLRDRIREFADAPGLVVDLRYNPGGAVIAAMYAVGHFLDPSEVVMVTFDRHEKRTRHVPFGKPGSAYRGKLAVLVSDASASGSEVFAAAIQEQKRGIILGQKTAGSVLQATRLDLPDKGVLQLSVTDLVTGRGFRLENAGVTPDVPFSTPTLDDLGAGRDPGLERAIEALLKS